MRRGAHTPEVSKFDGQWSSVGTGNDRAQRSPGRLIQRVDDGERTPRTRGSVGAPPLGEGARSLWAPRGPSHSRPSGRLALIPPARSFCNRGD